MRKLLLPAAAALLAIGCARVQSDPATGATDVDVENPVKQGEDWNARLTSQSGSTITGTSQALVADGRTRVSISISGASSGASHPWHVHAGSCGSGGPVVGPATAYPPLDVGSAGTATGNAELSLTLNEASDYHVNVHQSAADMGTIVACGNLDD
jgi:superoxide dismutase, Cu-Zn family